MPWHKLFKKNCSGVHSAKPVTLQANFRISCDYIAWIKSLQDIPEKNKMKYS